VSAGNANVTYALAAAVASVGTANITNTLTAGNANVTNALTVSGTTTLANVNAGNANVTYALAAANANITNTLTAASLKLAGRGPFKIDYGTIAVGAQSSGTVLGYYNFTTAFTNTPVVVISSDDAGDAYITTRDVSTTSFRITVWSSSSLCSCHWFAIG
jgi:hypothetical protein